VVLTAFLSYDKLKKIYVNFQSAGKSGIGLGGVEGESKGNTCMYRVQAEKLQHNEEQEE
jgi:hypothetical protein